jgi:hypothetical protein
MRITTFSIIGALILLGAGWYVLRVPAEGSSSFVAEETPDTKVSSEPRPVPERCGQTSSRVCEEYRNEQYGFSVFHPRRQKVDVFDEGQGAATIVFENSADARGFQIFIVPYSEPQVTEERFTKDVRTGVRENVSNITIDGATGAAFDSKSIALGDTREKWFVHGGYLYEVTTPRYLTDMIGEVMATWEFI